MTLTVWAPDGIPEVRPGNDLATLLTVTLAPADRKLVDGDVVVVTSKVVSKAEGRVRRGDRKSTMADETTRIVASRGPTAIVRNRLGLTMAAAGIDASNVEAGSVVLLPVDPDASARSLRTRLRQQTGVNVAVVVTDTAGRAWREGQTDIAVGAAGMPVALDHRGQLDRHGNELAVTAPAVADEIAGAAELVCGKLTGRPFAVVSGLGHLVLPADDQGPGAAALIRPETGDLFGYGAREAVLRALTADPRDRAGFGAPAPADDLAGALRQVLGTDAQVVVREHELVEVGVDPRVPTVAFACGWTQVEHPHSGVRLRLRPATP